MPGKSEEGSHNDNRRPMLTSPVRRGLYQLVAMCKDELVEIGMRPRNHGLSSPEYKELMRAVKWVEELREYYRERGAD